MPLTPFNVCPKCGADAANVTSLSDTHEKFLCFACGEQFDGPMLDLVEKQIALARMKSIVATIRAYESGD